MKPAPGQGPDAVPVKGGEGAMLLMSGQYRVLHGRAMELALVLLIARVNWLSL